MKGVALLVSVVIAAIVISVGGYVLYGFLVYGKEATFCLTDQNCVPAYERSTCWYPCQGEQCTEAPRCGGMNSYSRMECFSSNPCVPGPVGCVNFQCSAR